MAAQKKKSVSKISFTENRYGAYTFFMETEISFTELRRREVINGSDGKRLGHIVDMIFSAESGKVCGIILPYGKRGVFGKSQDLYVPWSCVQKIGEDVILVEILDLASGSPICIKSEGQKSLPEPPPPHKKNKERDCDGKCEKCMLFDCSARWDAV